MEAEKSLNYIPQLIIGLDSLNDDANYIHIKDVKQGQQYYCSCCHNVIKPRAISENKDYQVQPHFYHINGGCNEETFIHYIYKTWLFESGSKFIVGGKTYIVRDVELEKVLNTSFGKYKPDIIVTTTTNKIFYFEIYATNKKTDNYIPKWDELGNDVIEVDTKSFINQKYENKIPVFDLIYSNGECFIKKYIHKKYRNIIEPRKLEWKRQDKLNYKIQWERLDWFWLTLSQYKDNSVTKDVVLESFKNMSYEDKVWCYQNIKTKSCVSLKKDFRQIINDCFFDMLNTLSEQNKNLVITCEHISPLIYLVNIKAVIPYLNYILHENSSLKIRVQKGGLLNIKDGIVIKENIIELNKTVNNLRKQLDKINKFNQLSCIESITPYSNWAVQKYNLSQLKFKIRFYENIHSKFIKEYIGENIEYFYQINDTNIKLLYETHRDIAFQNLSNEIIKELLKRNVRFEEVINRIRQLCEQSELDLQLCVDYDHGKLTLLNKTYVISQYLFTEKDIFGEFENKVLNYFTKMIDNEIKIVSKISEYSDQINNCNNKIWSCNYWRTRHLVLTLHDTKRNCIDHIGVDLCTNDINNIKQIIFLGMQNLIKHAENYCEVRVMEVTN